MKRSSWRYLWKSEDIRNKLLISLLLLAIFGLGMDFILMALAPTLEWLFVGRIIAGICGASWIIASAYIADVTSEKDRSKNMGLIGAAFGLGFVLGPAIAGMLTGLGENFPALAAAFLSLANFVMAFLVLEESLGAENRRPRAKKSRYETGAPSSASTRGFSLYGSVDKS